MTPMTLFVYGDPFKYHLLATCRIEIHARPVIYTKIKVGKVSQHTLMIPTKQDGRVVRVHSNNPQLVQPTGKFIGDIPLNPNSLNAINVEVRPTESNYNTKSSSTPTLINCVDKHSQEVIYGWLMILQTIA